MWRVTDTEDAGHEDSAGGPGKGLQVSLDWAGESREWRPRDVEPGAAGEAETGQMVKTQN